MTKEEIKEIAKQVYKEEQDYQQLFKTMLNKTGKDINSMSDSDKKVFFNAVDKAYNAKSEGKLTGYKHSIDENIFQYGILIPLAIKFTVYLFTFIYDYYQDWKTNWHPKSKNASDIVDYVLGKVHGDDATINAISDYFVKNPNDNANTIANKLVKLPNVQSHIKVGIKKFVKPDDKNKIEVKEIEDGIKTVFTKVYSDRGITNTIGNKIKNDIK
jgi:hypothetical protein